MWNRSCALATCLILALSFASVADAQQPRPPLLVHETVNPALSGFVDSFSCEIPDGVASCTDEDPSFLGTNAPNLVVVVETITARVVTPTGQKVGDLSVLLGNNVQIPLSFQGTIGAFDYYAALIPVKIYVNGEAYRHPLFEQFRAFRGADSGLVRVDVKIFGHLVKK